MTKCVDAGDLARSLQSVAKGPATVTIGDSVHYLHADELSIVLGVPIEYPESIDDRLRSIAVAMFGETPNEEIGDLTEGERQWTWTLRNYGSDPAMVALLWNS